MMRTISNTFLVLGAAALLPACATVQSANDQEAAELTAQANVPMPDQWTTIRQQVGPVEMGWIAAFDDPVLTALVEEAQRNNPNLQAAAASVARANALARQAGAPRLPSLNAALGGERQEVIDGPRDISLYSAGLEVAYELDVWGRVAAGEGAALASAEAAQADYVFAQYSLAAAVARSYFLVIESRKQVEVASGVFLALTEIVRIVELRFVYGFASEYDVALALSDLESARDTLAAAENGQIEALRNLEALVGRYPAGLLETATDLPELPPAPGAGLPSQLLERRPDIRAAERDVAAALNARSAARAARLPSLSLSTAIGGASNELGDILDPGNVVWSLAGNLLAPIFNGGALNAAVDVADADVEGALALYADTALTAFTEVETALDRGVFLRQRRAALEASANQSRNALRLSNLRYQQGEIDLFDVLGTQQRVFGAESSLLALKRAQLNQHIELSLALGGDWREGWAGENP
ncbi:MAG: TolC family protein [Erythrobacter sp.]|nr:TolC family protein [Erythrobacter sp.]